MKKTCLFFSLLLVQTFLFAQKESLTQYEFTPETTIECTNIKSQGNTGTCWSFATTSFLEAELIRMEKPTYDLSEMYAVRATYMDKAQNYLFRQGKANFSQGSLSHDVVNAYKMVGAVPESAYTGLVDGRKKHNHGKMEKALRVYLKSLLLQKEVPADWRAEINAIMDRFIGVLPTSFAVGDKKYTAESFTAHLDVQMKDYINITSFTHHPFYEQFVLEIPDNYSNGSYYNIPVEEMEAIADNALKNGFTIAWDGDVSEDFFNMERGIAIVPVVKEKTSLTIPSEEVEITQSFRQEEFEARHTTDDHLMHIVGLTKDQNGNKYYSTKNSWGETGALAGYINISAAYFQLKTVAILVHKDAIPTAIKMKMGF